MDTRNINKSIPLASTTVPTAAGSIKDSKKVDKASTPSAGDVSQQTSPPASGVNVALSARSKEIAESHKKALEIARNTPDVREDRVADIKKRIADGTYQVDSGKVADGMMREAILEHLATRGEQ